MKNFDYIKYPETDDDNNKMREALPHMESLHPFVKEWMEFTKDMTPEQVAIMVWQLANRQWLAGHEFDPNDIDEDDGFV